MHFSTVRSLVAWSFQMHEVVPFRVQHYGERIPGAVRELTLAEQKNMAVDILAKVARLPEAEYSAIAAMFTGDQRAVNAAARVLPRSWPTGLRRELTRGWTCKQGLVRSQAEIAETYMRSQQTISAYWSATIKLLNQHYQQGMDAMESQLSDILNERDYDANHCKERVLA